MLQYLLLSNGSPDLARVDGRTPAHVAAEMGDLTALRALVNAGAWLDARDADGLTPLHAACRQAHPDCLFLLIVEGSDLSIKTHADASPEDLLLAVTDAAQRQSALAKFREARTHLFFFSFALFCPLCAHCFSGAHPLI